MISEPSRASSIGLLKYTPSVSPQSGSKRNECRPGPSKPQPFDWKMWQLGSKASTCVGSALTAGSFSVAHRYGNLVVSARRAAAVRHWTGVTDVGAAVGHQASRLSRRQLRCPRPRCRSWHRTIAGSLTRTYPGPTPHDECPFFSGFSAFEESGSTYRILAFIWARACAPIHTRVVTSRVSAKDLGLNSEVFLNTATKMNSRRICAV